MAIPLTVEEYCIKHRPVGSQSSDTNIDLCDDWYDEDYDDDDDGSECFDDNDGDDSGNADD